MPYLLSDMTDHTPTGTSSGISEHRSGRAARKNLNDLFSPVRDDKSLSPQHQSKGTTVECPLNTIARQLQSDFDETADEAAEALQALAISASDEVSLEIATSGVIQRLLERIKTKRNPEEELAALQNLCAAKDPDGILKRQMVVHGFIPLISEFLESESMELVQVAVANVLNLAIESPERKELLTSVGCIEKIAPLLRVRDQEMCVTAVSALTSLSIGSEFRKQQIDDAGVMEMIVPLLSDNEVDVKAEVLGLLQSLVYCNDFRKQKLIDMRFIETLTLLLASDTIAPAVRDIGSRFLKGLAGFSGFRSKQDAPPSGRSLVESVVDIMHYWTSS